LQDLADILNNLGGICFKTDRLDEALKYYHEASEIYEKIKEEDPSSYYKKNLMVLYNLANVYMDMNMLPRAEALHTTVCSMRKQLAQENPYVYTEPLADSATALARLYQKTQRYKEAENSQMAALKLRRYLVKNRTDRVQEYQLDLSTTLGNLANIYKKTNRYQEAEEYYNEALEKVVEEFDGFACRMVQHELSHLEGNLFVDNLSPIRRKMLSRKLLAISKGAVQTRYKSKR
jgi:tetratricopeptide (TPR) repeat protein